jgi:site-specific recombinase XerD
MISVALFTGRDTLTHMVWKGLTKLDEIRLMAAAQTLRVRPGPGTDRGLRNHVLLVILLSSGLRVSEVPGLDRDQYNGKGFERV